MGTRRIAPWVATVPLGLLIALGGLVAIDRMGVSALDTEITDSGTATVVGCQDEGVVDGLTVGDLWRCDLDVRWDSGRTERVTDDELTQFGPDDIGTQVAVVERQVPQGNRTAVRAPVVYRADFEPASLLVTVLVGGGACVVGAFVALSPLGRRRH